MSVKQKSSSMKSPTIIGSDAAPVIYTDGVILFGAYNGMIQLEVGSNILVPIPDSDEVKTKILITAHLRFSAATAASMIGALQKAIEMHRKAVARKKAPPSPSEETVNEEAVMTH